MLSCTIPNARPEHSLQLHRAHTFFSLAHDVGSGEPLDEWQVGVMEDRSACDRELIVTKFAIEKFWGFLKPHRAFAASGTLGAIRPAQPLQKFAASIIRRKGGAKINQGHRRASNG